jgi:hypothetical protein
MLHLQEVAEPLRQAPAVRVVPLLGTGCAGPQPVTLGVPWPRGALTVSEPLRLLDGEQRPAPLQTQPLAFWSDGSVKWLLLDFLAAPSAAVPSWRLEPGPPLDIPVRERVRVDETPRAVWVETGVASFELTPAALLHRVLLDGRPLPLLGGTRLMLTDVHGRAKAPRVDHFAVENRGPVRATVRLQGAFPGRRPCRFVVRLCFFAGTGLVRLRLTLHNPARARHPGGLWDLGDAGSVLFRDLSLVTVLSGMPGPQLTWTTEPGHPPRTGRGHTLSIYQGSSGGENWQSRNHVNRHGAVPCSLRGYRAQAAGPEEGGLRASPLVSLRQGDVVLSAAVPEFWQQFPKALTVEGGRLRLGLFPQEWGEPFELQGGEQKTHTAWLQFGGLETPPLDWAHDPLQVHGAPEWCAASGAIAFFPAAAETVGTPLEPLLAGAVEGPNSLRARREIIDEHGWRNYGDLYADHEAAHYSGPQPVISHYNNQYDVLYGALLQYARSGDVRWWQLAQPLARHIIDIDIYHTDRDKAAYNDGLFWHTDHYRDAATGTHRGYSRANCRPGDRSYGGGPSNEHNYTTGLLHYYFLTGEPDARDAVLCLADWVLAMDDGRRNVLGVVDDGPTGLASQTALPDCHGPGRGAGNSINALLDAWLVSGRRRYLDFAETLVRRCIHPDDDIAGRDLLNVERRWSYTVGLSVLARYLDVKAEAGELDAMYSYGRASLLRYAEWMLQHEEPYFAHPEKLEYPTETWAAQELRKANVLRLAARHAAEPLRGRLLIRGEEFASRAWSDLLRFESRTVTRALALVLIEGTRDAFFQTVPAGLAPPPLKEHGFEKAPPFIPQRQRVLAKMKHPWGALQVLACLSNPWRWYRYLCLSGSRFAPAVQGPELPPGRET